MTSTPLPKLITDYVASVLPSMHGWCTPEKATALASAIISQQPEVCVEIGVFAGRSLISIALALSHNGSGKVFGIDPWSPDASAQGFPDEDANRKWWDSVDHDFIFNQCRYFANSMGVGSIVELVKATSLIANAGFKAAGQAHGPFIDFLHIDGNHSEECSTFDVNNWVPLVREGGAVWFDDTDWETTKHAQSRLAELCEFVEKIGTCGIFKKR